MSTHQNGHNCPFLVSIRCMSFINKSVYIRIHFYEWLDWLSFALCSSVFSYKLTQFPKLRYSQIEGKLCAQTFLDDKISSKCHLHAKIYFDARLTIQESLSFLKPASSKENRKKEVSYTYFRHLILSYRLRIFNVSSLLPIYNFC